LNHALVNVPADRVRLHVYWGNYEGPHTHDIPLVKILPIALNAKPQALVLEAANPGAQARLGTLGNPRQDPGTGFISSTVNYIEHPEVVSQRILRYANLVGRDRVNAGSDCGFGTFAGFGPIYPPFCWMKLRSLAEGAEIASKKRSGRAGSAN